MATPDFFEDYQKEKIAAAAHCRSQPEINEAILDAFFNLTGQYFNRQAQEIDTLRRRVAALEKARWKEDAA